MSPQIKTWILEVQESIMAQNWTQHHPKSLYEPNAYMLKLGGKRMRPVLCLIGNQLFGGQKKAALGPAMAIEYFHNFTLIHDDIMDQSPIRRGQATVHEKWDVNTAILSGDVLYTLAFEHFADQAPEHYKTLVQGFVKTAREVCEGQQLDMDLETQATAEIGDYLEMIRLKTAVLLAYSLWAGAITAGASPQEAQALYKVGQSAGLAFQLKDDWLDTFGETSKTGKRQGNDILADKKTFLYLHTLQSASPEDRQSLLAWEGKRGPAEQKIGEVKTMFERYGAGEACTQGMDRYFQEALEQLDALPAVPSVKEDLKELLHYLKEREK